MDQTINKPRKTMSVPEMRQLLGLKKTESYWLVHRGVFETKMIDGHMRVDLASFEKWYANQVKHKKVNGEAPGAELKKKSYSFQEAANILSIHDSILYEIWKEEGLPTITVDFVRRIPADVFERWYESQSKYQKVEKVQTEDELRVDFLSIQEVADLLGISKEQMSGLTRRRAYRDYFEIKTVNNQRWISKKSLQYFLNAQNEYQITSNEQVRRQDVGTVREVLPETKEYLSRKEAAVLAGVTLSTITKWTQMEHFPCVGAGTVLRIPREAFRHWLNEYQQGGR